MKLGQNTKSRSLIIMNIISGVYDVIVTSYENRDKIQIYGETTSNMPKKLKIDHRIHFSWFPVPMTSS